MSQLAEQKENLLSPGHNACAGCGLVLAARLVLNAAGPEVIVTNATGCLEVTTTNYPFSAWRVPWIHSLFENSAAVASGVEAALRAQGKLGKVKVIAQGGDGATADIGMMCLSGMWERGHDVLYVCYDNEAYMNTGIQRSSLTPFDASTSTSPSGKVSLGNPTLKKDVPAIALAHRLPYVATASVAYPQDLEKKVKKALSITGPKYLQIHSPCPLGWGFKTALTIKAAKAAVQTGLYPLFEYEKGQLASVRKITKPQPVEVYLKDQIRFRHLFKDEAGKEQIAKIQEIANQNIIKFSLSG